MMCLPLCFLLSFFCQRTHFNPVIEERTWCASILICRSAPMPVETVLPLCSLFHFFPMTRLDNLFFFSNRERAFAPKAPLFTLCYFFEKFFNKMSVPRIRTSRLNSFILLIPKSHSFIFILLLLSCSYFWPDFFYSYTIGRELLPFLM